MVWVQSLHYKNQDQSLLPFHLCCSIHGRVTWRDWKTE